MGLLHRFFGAEQSAPAAVVNHDGPWQKAIRDHPREGPKPDSAELRAIDPANDEPTDIEGLSIAFEYVDADGEITKRSVMCRRCWRSKGQLYLGAFCTLRQDYRMFKVAQMSDIVEVRTKKSIADPIGYFGKYAFDKLPKKAAISNSEIKNKIDAAARGKRDYGHGERITDARRICLDGVRVLAYVATARDGKINATDEGAEDAYIKKRLEDCGLAEDSSLATAVLQYAIAIAVPTQAFEISLKILAADQLNYLSVVSAMAKLVDGTTPNAAEAEVGDRVLAAGRDRGWLKT